MSILLIAVYCVVIAAGSFWGGQLPAMIRLSHTSMQALMSFVGGLMLGVALLHLLPHAIHQTHIDVAAWATLVGLVSMFCLIRVFQIHHHGPEPEIDQEGVGHHHGPTCVHHLPHEVVPLSLMPQGIDPRVAESGGKTPGTGAPPTSSSDAPHVHGGGVHQFSWTGLFGGLALHTLLDGVALAASVAADGVHDSSHLWLGFGTFLAVLLHKPLEAMSIVSVMQAARWPKKWVVVMNAAFSLMCPLGAVLFYFGLQGVESQPLVVGIALGFSAGVFLCVALADLLPEVQFHSHDRVSLTLSLLAGVALASLIGLFEPEHAHQHAPGQHSEHDHGEHSDHGHDHDAGHVHGADDGHAHDKP